MKYREFLRARLKDSIPQNLALPSGFHVVGHVALLHLNPELMEYVTTIGKATLDYDHRLKSVAVKTGPTKGIERRPFYEVVAGSKDTVTLHVENKVRFKFDPVRMTFSGGNKGERIGMSRRIKLGECVVDMFACVGQFALHIAKRNDVNVIAIEINPEAYEFLVENIEMNELEDKVTAVLGNCRIVHPTHVASRVIMGYLHDTETFLPYALETLIKEGGIIHMHKAVSEKTIEENITCITDICRKHEFVPEIEVRKIKNYSPGISHVVFDISVESV
ncbi:MAG: class I SAM-dependent methyltransferase family protein [Candidatus Thorarchaeota archaeon]|nr:class I SAM-dependent methyltransferase family protein [Candidatus Thorarchaeota archaeon]